MKDFYQISDTITKYLKGQLSGEELTAFSSQLDTDPELREEVAFQKLVMEGIKSSANEQLRAQIKSTIIEMDAEPNADQQPKADETIVSTSQSNTKIIPLGKRILSIAASLLILLAVGGLWNANQNYTNNSLISAYHDLPSPTIGLKGNAENNANLFKEVAKAYSDEDYREAIRLLNTVQASPIYTKAQYHLGNVLLEIQQPEEAIEVFEGLLTTGDVRYKDLAEWLLAIAYLQKNDLEKTESQLDKILQNPDHSMHGKAAQLKKQLNSFWRKMIL